jgi:beta-glucosidase
MDGLRIALPGVELVHSDDDPSVASNCDVVLVVVGYTRFDEGEYIGEGMGDALQHLLPPMDHPTLGMQADYIPSQSNASNTQTPQSSSPEIAVAPLGDAAGGDRQSIRLSEADETLIRGACATSAAVIVVVMGGSAVVMPWLDETSATLMIWYPGMEGGNALADVLLGKTEPGGRLPFVIPRTADELPHFDRDEEIDHYDLLHGQWYLDSKRTPPHKAFGFGMGYTSWRIVEAARAEDHVAVTLVNTGPREGSTVLMIFGSVPSSEYERAPRKLMGFERISLKSEESREIKVAFDIRVLDLRVEGKWVREQKPVELSLGFSATEADLIYLQ